MKKIISKLLITIGIVLILYACFLLGKSKIEEQNAGKKSDEIIDILNKKDNIIDGENKSIIVDNINYVATIKIDKLGLILPIAEKFSYEILKKTPAIYQGRLDSNNLVICAHGYKKHFLYLDKLKSGDSVVITDLNRTETKYRVEVVEVLRETDIENMLTNDFDLTLFTCTKDGKSRVTIRCNKVD